MLEAPKGFIPLAGHKIVNVKDISGVSQLFEERETVASIERREAHEKRQSTGPYAGYYPNATYEPIPEKPYVVVYVGSQIFGVFMNCSLVQFMAKIAEALAE